MECEHDTPSPEMPPLTLPSQCCCLFFLENICCDKPFMQKETSEAKGKDKQAIRLRMSHKFIVDSVVSTVLSAIVASNDKLSHCP